MEVEERQGYVGLQEMCILGVVGSGKVWLWDQIFSRLKSKPKLPLCLEVDDSMPTTLHRSLGAASEGPFDRVG